MKATKNFLSGKKTYIVSTLMVLVSITNFLAGDTSLVDVVTDPNLTILLVGLGLASLRAGIEKNTDK